MIIRRMMHKKIIVSIHAINWLIATEAMSAISESPLIQNAITAASKEDRATVMIETDDPIDYFGEKTLKVKTDSMLGHYQFRI